MKKITAEQLETLYARYNRREYVSPDPLQFLYNYSDVRDREIVGLIASGLAYGRVRQILKSVDVVLKRMEKPAEFLRGSSRLEMERTFADFKHRFTTGEELTRMLIGMKQAIENFGSLEACFLEGYDEGQETICPAAREFVRKIASPFAGERNSLLPNPEGTCAFKRLNLYLRWMVRKDAVDPGGWDGISKSKLVVPLDTHMHRIGSQMGLTKRKAADHRTAREITAGFRRFSPYDAVKYDFALTRFGIRDDFDRDFLSVLSACGK
jgi:uncharacterized protein (TIGR02757 family)